MLTSLAWYCLASSIYTATSSSQSPIQSHSKVLNCTLGISVPQLNEKTPKPATIAEIADILFTVRFHRYDQRLWMEKTIDPSHEKEITYKTKVRFNCAVTTGFPLFYWPKKSRTFIGLSTTPSKIFQDMFATHQCVNIKKKRHLLIIFRV